MKKWLIYAGLFTGSFLLINVASYFFITKNKTFKKVASERSAQNAAVDSLRSQLEATLDRVDSTAVAAQADSLTRAALGTSDSSRTEVADREPASAMYLTDDIAKVVEGYEARLNDLARSNYELQFELDRLKQEKESRRVEMEEIWAELSASFLSNLNKDVQNLKTLVAKHEAAKLSAAEQSVSNSKDLAKILDKMKAEAAAPILSSLDDEMAIDIMRSLTPRQAGKILEVMEKTRAVTLSRKMNRTE